MRPGGLGHNKLYRVVVAYSVAIRVFLGYYILFKTKKWYSAERYAAKMDRLHARNARRVNKAILRLNGLFIKIGQMISSMGHALPDQYLESLEGLQDSVPFTAERKVRSVIERELGSSIDSMFKEFHDIPVASASIAQVHKACKHDGTWVAVKVKHEDIDRIARIDLEIMRRLHNIGNWFMKMEGMDFMHTQVERMIHQELDLEIERSSMLRIKENLSRKRGIVIPEVHEALSSKTILTTTWYDGVKITNKTALSMWEISPTAIAKKLIDVYCAMVFDHGFYHADPHPGNLLVTRNGDLVLLDFGAVGEVSEELKNGIPRMIEAAIRNDSETVVRVSQEIGFLSDGPESAEVAELLITALKKFFRQEMKFTNLNFREADFDPFNNSMTDFLKEVGMKKVARAVQIPRDWVLLNRMASLSIGVCATLDPTFNPLDVARPYLRRRLFRERQSLLKVAWAYVDERLIPLKELASKYEEPVKRAGRAAAVAVFNWLDEVGSAVKAFSQQ